MGRFNHFFQHPTLTQSGWKPVGHLLLSLLAAGAMLFGLFTLLTAPVDAAGGFEITKSASPNPVKAGENFVYTIVITNRTGANVIANITDTIPSGVTVVNSGGATQQNGVLEWTVGVNKDQSQQVGFTARVTRAGQVINSNYRVSSGDFDGVGTPVSVNVIPNDPDRVLIEAVPASVIAGLGTTAQLTITVADAYGNPVADSTAVAITYNKGMIDGQPAGSVITGMTNAGRLEKTLNVLTVAGTINITATANGVSAGYKTVTVTPAAPNKVTVSAAPTTISTDNGQESVITAIVSDQYGNAISGLPITFTTNLGFLNDTLTTVKSTTTNGQATVRLDGTTAGTATVSAQVAGLPAGQTQVYLAPGVPTQLKWNPPSDQAVSVVADGVSAANVELLVLDKHSNRIATPIMVTFTTNLGTLPNGNTTYSTVTSNGTAPVALTSITRTGTANLQAKVYLASSGIWLNTDRSINFVAGNPVSVGLTINPPSIVADGASTTEITAYAYDANQNVVKNVPLTFTFAYARGFLVGGDPTENTTTGTAVRTLRSDTQLGIVPITVTIQGIPQPGKGNVNFVVGPPHDVGIVAKTQQITVNNSVPLTLTVHDGFGHVIPNLPITVATTIGAIQPTIAGTTNGSGVLTRNLFSTLAGVANISVTSYNGQVPVSGHTTVTYRPDAPYRATLTVQPAQIVADGVTTALITVTVTDIWANPVAGVTPVLTTTAGTLLDTGGVTNAAGQTTRRLRSTTQLTTATVDVAGLIADPVQVGFVTGPAYSATVKATPTTAYVNITELSPNFINMVITVTDRVGHPIVGTTPTVTVYVDGILAQVSNCTSTDAQGRLTCTLRSTKSGTATVHVNELIATGDTITFNPGTAALYIEISPKGTLASPVHIIAGQPTAFTAVAQDAYRNVIPDASFTWLLRPGSTNPGSGSIDTTGVVSGEQAGQMVIEVGSNRGGYAVDYIEIDPAVASKANLSINPDAVGIGSYADLTLTVTDEFNNPIDYVYCPTVKTTLGTLTMNCTSASTGVALGRITSLTQTGTANLSVLNLSQVTGENTVVFQAGPPAKFKATAASTSLHANGTSTTNVTFTIQDNYGNPVVGGYTMYALSASLGTLTCPSQTTDTSGKIYCTLKAPTVEGTASFSVKYKVNQTLINNGSNTVNFFIGQLHHLVMTPTGPLTTTAGTTTTLHVNAYDVGNALIPASWLNFDWHLYQPPNSGYGEFSPTPTINDSTATFVSQNEGLIDVVILVTQQSDGFTIPPVSVKFNIIGAPPVQGDILVSPDHVLADGATPFTVTVAALQDSYTNQAHDGDTVYITLGLPTGERTVNSQVFNGQVRVVQTTTTQAGTFPITVTNSAGETLTLTGNPWVTFTPGQPAQAQIVSVTPPQIVADGSSTAAVTLQIKDRYANNVAAAWPLGFNTSLGTFPSSGTTDANGRVTGTMKAGLVLGSARITVTSGLSSFVASGSVPLVAGPPVSATVVASSTTLAAGGDSVPLHITVYDAWHHPVDGAVITPTISPSLGWFGGSTTAVNGLVTQLLAPFTHTGVATVGLQGLTVTGNLNYTFVPNVAALAYVQASPTSLTVGETAAFTVTVTDAYANIVPPTSITVASVLNGKINGQPSPVTRTTAAGTGRFSLTLTATDAGTETLSLTGPAGPLNFRSGSQAAIYQPDKMIIVTLNYTQPITAMAGSPLRLTASSRDKFYNIIDPWQPYDYTWQQTSNTNMPGSGQFTPVDSHSRSVDFVPFKVGQNRLRALNDTFASNYLTVTVVAAAPTEALIGSQTPSVVADNVSTTTISMSNMTDAYGNGVQDGHIITVTVDTRVATGVVAGGKANIVLTATKKAGTYAIRAVSSAGTVNLAGYPTVTFRPGPAARAVVKASEKFIKIDTVTATLTITAYDKYDNLVSPSLITATVSRANVGGNGELTVNGRTVRSITPIALGDGNISLQGENGPLFIKEGDTKVVFISGDPKIAILTAAQPKLTANGLSSTTLDFTLKDGLYNSVGSIGTAVITVSRGTLLSTMTNVIDGKFQVTLRSEPSVGVVDINVAFNGTPMIVEGDTVEFIPGVARRAVLTATPTTVQLDTTNKSTLQFSLFDLWNNPVAGGTAVTVTSSIGSVSPIATTSSGNLVNTTFSPGTVANTVVFTLTATGSLGPLALSGNTVTVLPGSINRIAITPTTGVWVNAGSSVTLGAIGYDKYDNRVSYGPFNWRKIYGSGDGLLKNGVFTGTLAGTLGIQAYTGTVYSPEKAVTVLPGAVYSAVVSANPITVPIGGVPSQLQITLRDKYGNFVADNTSASVTTDLGTLQGSGVTNDGVLTRTLLSSQFSGRAHISVNGKAAGGDTVFFSPRAWVTGNPETLLANGVSKSEIWVRMLDGDGLPTGATPATITTTLGTLDPAGCTEEANFVYVCSLTAATEPGVARIFVDGFQAEGGISMTVGTPAKAYVAVNPPYITTHGLNTATITVTVKDAYGHTITDYNQPLTVTSSLGTLSGSQPTVNGVTRRLITGDDVAGWASLQVTGFTVTGTTQVEIVQPHAQIASSAAYLSADGQNAAELTISLLRPDGKVITYVNAPISVTTSLGTLTGAGSMANGVAKRTLTAGYLPGTALLSVANIDTITGIDRIPIHSPVVKVTATPKVVPADGKSQVLLKFTLQDIYGKTLSHSTMPMSITTSLGSLSGSAPTVSGVTYRALTAASAAGMAQLGVAGLPVTGDSKVQFVGTKLLDGSFDNGLTDWIVGQVATPTTVVTPVYSATTLNSEFVGLITVLPFEVSTKGSNPMARLGATTPDNTSHELSEIWLRQSVYVSPTGVTQASFRYRLLSYDVKVGSPPNYREYDPFEVFINGSRVMVEGFEWSYDWQDWYDGDPWDPSSSPPPSPKDTGWKLGILDLTPWAGQIISLEFRVPNRQTPVDNTWVYLDDIGVVNQSINTPKHNVFLPIILR